MKKLVILMLLAVWPAFFVNGQSNRHWVLGSGSWVSRMQDARSRMQGYHTSDICHLSSFISLQAQETLLWKWDTVIGYDVEENPYLRMTQRFDEKGNLLSQLSCTYIGGTWVNLSRNTYTNDASGKVQSMLTEGWQEGAWVNFSIVNVTWNASSQIVMETVQKWSSGVLKNNMRRSYTYNTSGNKLTILQEDWSGTAWVNEMRTTYAYNASGYLLSMTVEASNAGGPWVAAARFTYSSDPQGNWIQLIYEEWSGTAWVLTGKIDYTTDPQGNITSETIQNYVSGSWVNDSRKTYTYDVNSNGISGKNEAWQGSAWVSDMQTSVIYNKKEILAVLSQMVYHYTARYRWYSTGTEELIGHETSLRISPNPAKNLVTVKFENADNSRGLITVCTIEGKTVASQPVNSGEVQIDVSGLPAGVYLLNLKLKETLAKGKILIEK